MRVEVQLCGKEALDDVYWPNLERPMAACSEHALMFRRIADKMGFRLTIQARLEAATCQLERRRD